MSNEDRKEMSNIWRNGTRWLEVHFEDGKHILKSKIVSSYEEYLKICQSTPTTSPYNSIAYVAYAALPGKRSVLRVIERRHR